MLSTTSPQAPTQSDEVSSSTQAGMVTVALSPDAAGRYGFNVRGGADLEAPVVVSRVASTPSTQGQTPHLQEGDQVCGY